MSCPLCKNDKYSVIPYTNSAFPEVDIFDDLKIRVCAKCGFGWSYPFLDADTLSAFYSKNYGASKAGLVAGKQHVTYDRPISQLLLAKIFGEIKEGDNFLDIGGGSGPSFYAAKPMMPPMNYYTFETSLETRGLLENMGAKILPGLFTPETSLPIKFKLILMSHILEHFNGRDIVPILKAVKDLLAPGGIFICEVPNADMTKHSNMRYNDACHLSFFSKGSLEDAMTLADFRIKWIRWCGQNYAQWWHNDRNKVRAITKAEKIGKFIPESKFKEKLRYIHNKLTTPSIEKYLSQDLFEYNAGGCYLRAVGEL